MDIADQNKPWAPHIICGSCRSNLEGWLRDSGKVMSFAVPRVWRKPQNDHDEHFEVSQGQQKKSYDISKYTLIDCTCS